MHSPGTCTRQQQKFHDHVRRPRRGWSDGALRSDQVSHVLYDTKAGWTKVIKILNQIYKARRDGGVGVSSVFRLLFAS